VLKAAQPLRAIRKLCPRHAVNEGKLLAPSGASSHFDPQGTLEVPGRRVCNRSEVSPPRCPTDQRVTHGYRFHPRVAGPFFLPAQEKSHMEALTEPVSFDDEALILVDSHDHPIGSASKVDAHQGRGTLHRAFSIFLFDGPDRVLLQQRSNEKALWPGFWSNSCCSHPRLGEDYRHATRRRLFEELGVKTPLFRLYQFEYHAQFNERGAEHELCTVFVGNVPTDQAIKTHPAEIADARWIDPEALDRELANTPSDFTPWLKLEWQTMRSQYWSAIDYLISQ